MTYAKGKAMMASVTVTSAASNTVRPMIAGYDPEAIWWKLAPVSWCVTLPVKPLRLQNAVMSIKTSELT